MLDTWLNHKWTAAPSAVVSGSSVPAGFVVSGCPTRHVPGSTNAPRMDEVLTGNAALELVAKQLYDPWWGGTWTSNRINRVTIEKTWENHGLNLNPMLGIVGRFRGFNVSIGLSVSRPVREYPNEQLGTVQSRKRGASGGICGALGDHGWRSQEPWMPWMPWPWLPEHLVGGFSIAMIPEDKYINSVLNVQPPVLHQSQALYFRCLFNFIFIYVYSCCILT